MADAEFALSCVLSVDLYASIPETTVRLNKCTVQLVQQHVLTVSAELGC